MRFAALPLLLLAGRGLAAEHPGRLAFDAAGCRSCHRIGRVGGNAGPDLTLVGFRRSREWLDLWLKDPKGWKKDALMPRFRLADGDRRAVVDYLSTLKGPAPWKGAPGSAVFRKAGCVACHGPRGSGGHPNNNVPGGLVPALDKVPETYSKTELVERIRRGSRPLKADPAGPEPLVSMPAWAGVLSDEDIEAVADYLLKANPGPAPGSEW